MCHTSLFMKFFSQLYEGDLNDEDALRKWAMSLETLTIDGLIEEISVPMLNYIYELEDQFVVLFYETDDRDADEIIEGLEGQFLHFLRYCSLIEERYVL